MEKIIVNDFLDFIKQKYNLVFLVLVFYIVRFEIDYAYILHMTFDNFFMDNPVINYILTIIHPSNLKLIEIFFKFNLTFIITYLLFYTKISPPKDLKEFLFIKRNFYFYPLIFIYILFCIYIYNLLIYTTTASLDFKAKVDFLQAFIAIEFGFYIVFNYPLTNFIDRKWNMKTSKEYSIWANHKFTKKDFVQAVSAGFSNEADLKKAKELGLSYPSQLNYYAEMIKGHFPTLDEYFDASKFDILTYEEWANSKEKAKLVKSKSEFRVKHNIFDFKDYFLFSLKSKYNIFFIVVLAISMIDYFFTISGFYNRTDYLTKLTMINFVNRWIFFYSIIFFSYFVFFILDKNPKRAVDIIYFKINSILYPLIFLIITNFRLEIFSVGKPKPFMDLETRILQNIMQPFLGAGIAVLIIFIPLIVISVYSMESVDKNKYQEFLDGNFVTFSGYKKTKTLSVNVNLDYSYLLMNQDYFKSENNSNA